ncbi:cupin-like domain-containing protein [Ferrimonas marina]|uniref:Cupin-like domain-containing protein n=1 Tax=Ferrimonas marina TaxID=299255 RepID=A0A1M5YW50_9GAMM|nr:cupin-like domain-containing protein [Ferrimonas marina]SHI16276.1 Cupin-like domain-containing protein [Ferrimonas marina]
MKAVERINGSEISDLDALIQSRTSPLVLEGYCRHWPLVQAGLNSDRAAMDYLLTHYTGQPITAYRLAPEHRGRVFYNDSVDGFNYEAGHLTLGQLLSALAAEMEKSEPCGIYMGSTNLAQWFPTMVAEHSLNPGGVNPVGNLWLGNQTRVAAHYDFPQNLACNLVGERVFTLFPPEQVDNLYVGPLEFAPGGQAISMVELANPDLERFPRFAEALAVASEAVLAPGDVLYLPSMWWHHVEGRAPLNVLLTHWWRDTPGYLGRPENALQHAILALRNLPAEQRQAWKAQFEHYVFDHDGSAPAHLPEASQGMLRMPMDPPSAQQVKADLLHKLKRQ